MWFQSCCCFDDVSIYFISRPEVSLQAPNDQTREITQDHIFHSDRGVQYASNQMTNLFSESKKITQSISRKGNCWDNAVAESFFKTLKYECINRYCFKSILEAKTTINRYINWYNCNRLHSTLNYKTPAEIELEIKINNIWNIYVSNI